MSGAGERRAARSAVRDYHEAELRTLVNQVGVALDAYRAGELDAFEFDEILFQYSRAAKELWKFCNLTQPEFTAALIRKGPAQDWWERGAPRRRR
ncbi:hypothetical protein Q0Z83_009740 [Actinoplanes sichuanensis]|uniref:Uncharacterized protein n=1 Tax=Actinoplanes sichuanensis TaxID=512349 RepID=A0ABW4AF06_9ACTN|nr:hypothetical protein [Actinoplanes sichuanensis]BEL02783.1 hypothetical protein Q0Z83_009740 [Actinoplanes sichuanensis]